MKPRPPDILSHWTFLDPLCVNFLKTLTGQWTTPIKCWKLLDKTRTVVLYFCKSKLSFKCEKIYIVHILCIFCVYIVYILRIYWVYIVYILCIYCVYIAYKLWIYCVYIVHILCIFCVYIAYILRLYFVCIFCKSKLSFKCQQIYIVWQNTVNSRAVHAFQKTQSFQWFCCESTCTSNVYLCKKSSPYYE